MRQSRGQRLVQLAPMIMASVIAALSIATRMGAPLPTAARSVVMAAAVRLDDLKVYELKAVCRAKGLKVSGRKAELIARIAAAPPGVVADTAASRGRGGSRRGRGPGRGGRGDTRQAREPDRQPPTPSSAAVGPVEAAAAAIPSVAIDAGGAWPSSSAQAGVPVAASMDGGAQLPPADVEVVADEAAFEADDRERRALRRAERRAKLTQYFDEEFRGVLGALELRAGAQYQAQFSAAAERAALPAAPPAAGVGTGAAACIEAARTRGRRLAWCKSFDASLGTGVITDLEERREWAVDRLALSVDARAVTLDCRVLHPGEFCEYDPLLAQEYAEGGAPRDTWVGGLLGWPLMCEARVQRNAEI